MEKPDGGMSEEIAEALEALWTLEERPDAIPGDQINPALVEQLQRCSLVAFEQGRPRLLPRGREMAERIIRRHRLAERLICDVLGVNVDESEAAACEFEHLIAEGITSSICTLLGHPRLCPHNRPIPEGDCCRQAREEVKPIVVSSDMLDIGEAARVAYVATREHSRLLRLSALGITPGVTLKMLQKWPSYVIQCEETEIALEPDVARTVYVWGRT
jgi:DtxR family Mn-dependent transcriptional regulator